MTYSDSPGLACCRCLLLLVFAFGGVLSSRAQPAVGVERYGSWPGYVRGYSPHATASRTRLVTSVYPVINDPLPNYPAAIQVFDISTRVPSRPDCILSVSNGYAGKPVLFGDSQGCAVLGSAVYSATTTFLRIYDVRHASTSALVAQLSYPGPPVALTGEGSLLVVTHAPSVQSTSMSLIDVGNPMAPVRLVTFSSKHPIQGARVFGTRLLTWGSSLEVYDIATPKSPVLLGQFPLSGVTYDVAASGDYAYVALGNEFDPTPGIQVVDLSAPTTPVNAGILSGHFGGCFAVRVVGPSLLSVDAFGFVTRWSLATPAKPRELESILLENMDVGTYDLSATAASGVDHQGRVRVAGWGPDGSAVTNLGGTRLELTGTSLHLAAAGTRVFLGDSGLSPVRIFDVSAPGIATEVIAPDKQGLFSGYDQVFDVDASGSRLVLQQPDGLVVFDVSNPQVPVRLGLIDGTSQPGSFRLRGNRLVSARGNTLTIHDLTQPGNPILLGTLKRTPGSYASMDTDGTLAAVADDTLQFGRSVAFYDVSDAANPRELSRMTFGDGPGGVKLGGGFAYVAAYEDGVRIYDVRVPQKPVLAAHVEFANPVKVWAMGVTLQGQLLYVAARTGGLMVYDVSDPYHPRLVGRHPVDGDALDVALSDRGVCVAAAEYGLQVFGSFPITAGAPMREAAPEGTQFRVALSKAGLEGANAVVTAESALNPAAGPWEPVPPSWLQSDGESWSIRAPTTGLARLFRFRVEFP